MHNNGIMNTKYITCYLYTVICLLFVSAQSVRRYHFNFNKLILIIIKENSKGESSENLIDGC